MRSATRLLAAVQRGSRFLEPGAPTGLTGLATHAGPRTALLYYYSSTLDKLKQFPEHSVYRQSTEALTKHRMKIIETIKPAGLEEWQQRISHMVKDHPEAFKKVESTSGSGYNIVWKDADSSTAPPKQVAEFQEGVISEKERETQEKILNNMILLAGIKIPEIEPEPSLTVEQIGEIETKINAGLIEEVIQVAKGENTLAAELLESKVWEDLEEKPQPGQWTYHERDRHTSGTPPQN